MQIKIENYIFAGVTVTIDNVPVDQAKLYEVLLASAQAAAKDSLETFKSFQAAQKRFNARYLD